MADLVTAEIVRNYMEGVAEQIINTMVRTSINPIFNQAHDCSAGVFYYDGINANIVARADAVPVHIYGALTSVQACLDFFHGDLNEGDIIIVCDPYWGGTHLGDYTVVKPVFYDGIPAFFPGVRAHTLDQGGPHPTGFSLFSREIWHEGFRFAPMKLYEKGELRREVWDLVRTNNRLPDMIEADIFSMIGGCRVGEERIRALCDKFGLEVVQESIEWIFDYSERMFRAQIRGWPNGVYSAESVLDTDFAGTRDVVIKAKVTVEDESIEVDFTGSAPQSQGIINSVPGNTMSYVYGVFSAICSDIPINSGFFRPLRAILPEKSVVNPDPPACAAYATVCIGCDIGDAVMKACEQFVPERVGTASIDLVCFWTHGVDARNGKFFIQSDYHASPCSSGGTKGVDGWGAWSALFCALKMGSIEMSEVQYPCLYWQGELATDTAAPGEWRGSAGYVCQRQPYKALGPVYAQIWIQGLRHPLHGFVGGRPGAGNYAVVQAGAENEEVVTEVAYLHPGAEGDVYYFQSCGGGGWGDSLSRDPSRVLADVLDEYVSVEGAVVDYGVVIDAITKRVDQQATDEHRKRAREARRRDPHWLALGRRRTLERVRFEEEQVASA